MTSPSLRPPVPHGHWPASLVRHTSRLALPALLALGSLLAGCGKSEGTASAVAAAPAAVAAAKGHVDIEGGVVRLAARRDGVIRRVLVEEGAQVEAGALLAELDNTLAERELALAEGELAHARRQTGPAQVRLAAAQRERRRIEPLAPEDLVAGQELDRARDEEATARAELAALAAAAEVAQHRVAVARQRIEEGLVRAPARGQIIRRQAQPGHGVSSLNVTPLFVFVPEAPRIVRAELEERFLGAVHAGQAAEVILEADDRRRFPAQVLRVGRMVGARTPSDDPTERQDNRVVECVLALNAADLLIGQRVVVRFNGRTAGG